MNIAVYIGVAFLLAFFVETTVEYALGTPIDTVPFLAFLKPYKWFLRYVAAIVGVFAALYWQIDLVAVTANVVAGLSGSADDAWAVSKLGIIVSGIAMGRGSNYLHEFFVKHLKKPEVIVA